MLERYQRLREFLPNLRSHEIDMLLLSLVEDREVDSLSLRLKDLDSVTRALQKEGFTLSELRALFDVVLDKYPETKARLGASAAIVESKSFESGIVKAQNGSQNELSQEEELALRSFKTSVDGELDTQGIALLLVQRGLKRQRIRKEQMTAYMDTRFVVPTSNA